MLNYSKIEWVGENSHHVSVSEHVFTLRKDHIKYHVTVHHIATKQIFVIESSESVDIDVLRMWVDELRRFEYLFHGAFHVMESCKADGEDITAEIRKIELGYFQNAEYKHYIRLHFTDKQYKSYFLRWMKLEKSLGIINQTMLYSSNVRGLPVDLRLAIASECYESLSEMLEDKGSLTVKKEPDSKINQTCPYCRQQYEIKIKGRKTFAARLLAIMEVYGKPIFSTEYRRRKSLIFRIIKTRNKVFHVKRKFRRSGQSKQKLEKHLNKKHCRFYSIKLDWMYRYIIWLLLGVNRDELDKAVIQTVEMFEKTFPDLVY